MRNSAPCRNSKCLSFLLWGVALSLLLAPQGFAQRIGGEWESVHHIFGTVERSFFGQAVAGVGDLDGDGWGDFVVGAPYENSDAGCIYAFSGHFGLPLWNWTACGRTGYSVAAAGDVNADGRPDVVVGSPRNNRITVLLHDGTIWWTVESFRKNHGVSVAGVGDVNMDGYDDLIVGADRADPGGRKDAGVATVYSGLDSSILLEFTGMLAGDRFGQALSSAGDVNADGYPDFLIGAPRSTRNGVEDVGTAYLYSGSTGYLLYDFVGPLVEDGLFGTAVCNLGDINTDGFDDVAISAIGSGHFNEDAGSIYVLSGLGGTLLHRIDGQTKDDHIGFAVSSLRDMNFDGRTDLAFTSISQPDGKGRVEIRSGADGTFIDSFAGTEPNIGFGESLSVLGDIEGRNLDAILTGAPATWQENLSGVGAVKAYNPNPFIFANTTRLSVASGSPLHIEITFPVSEAGLPYAVLLSGAGIGPTQIAGVQVPLSPGLLLSQMLTGASPINLEGAFGWLDANGQAVAVLHNDPPLTHLVGKIFHMAVISYQSNHVVTGRLSSIAWPIRITP